jgi:hypothetical protein
VAAVVTINDKPLKLCKKCLSDAQSLVVAQPLKYVMFDGCDLCDCVRTVSCRLITRALCFSTLLRKAHENISLELVRAVIERNL